MVIAKVQTFSDMVKKNLTHSSVTRHTPQSLRDSSPNLREQLRTGT